MKKIVLLLLGVIVFSFGQARERKNAVRDHRTYWCETAYKITYPLLDALSKGELKTKMPVEEIKGMNRKEYAHLEALGRVLCGLAPWLELGADATQEGKMRGELLALAHKGIRHAVDPASPDYMNFTKPSQPLVDAAFLAQGFLRSPQQLWGGLDEETQRMAIEALRQTRSIKPFESNWLLFSGMIEAFFLSIGEPYEQSRIDYAVNKHMDWYKGDGVYGDGPNFHWDYYNSYVIQPMLVDIAVVMLDKKKMPENTCNSIMKRAVRYAQVQERFISPEGTFPAIGRSLVYRTGAMQTLAQAALRHSLPEGVSPAQVRCALTEVTRRMFEAKHTFDENGWLTIGFAGHQPGVGESYICTGSLYLCSAGFLPLGLPATDEFWTAPAADWTSKKAWNGEAFPIDHAH